MLLPRRRLTLPGPAVWAATWFYFAYVVLGPVSWRTHKHVYTGDPDGLKSLRGVLANLRRGQLATFGKEVYAKFFFPAFLRYHRIYRAHTLGAGAWLISGVYNLRNQPRFVNGRWTDRLMHQKISGYIYAVTSFVKGLTASALSLKSHSLGWAKWPMAVYGVWDAYSLCVAMYWIWKRDIAQHRRWMIRNFSVGAGSIFVRLFAAVWCLFDLSFMTDPETYGRMNNIVLVGGFTQGWVFGEWWIARTRRWRSIWFRAMLATMASTALAARQMYRTMAAMRRAVAQREAEEAKFYGSGAKPRRVIVKHSPKCI